MFKNYDELLNHVLAFSNEIKNAVLYENKESSDAEANLLYKVLIIKFISRLGI